MFAGITIKVISLIKGESEQIRNFTPKQSELSEEDLFKRCIASANGKVN